MRNSAWFMAFLRRARLPKDETQLRTSGNWYATFVGIARSVSAEASSTAEQAAAEKQSAHPVESEATRQVKQSQTVTQRL
jgi:hypothetical protein